MIALATPYNRSETTAAALRLAEHLLALGEAVRLIGLGPITKGVHNYWDRQVRRLVSGPFKSLAACHTFINFGHAPELLDAIDLVSTRTTKNLFVPSLHGMSADTLLALQAYDGLICPSYSSQLALTSPGAAQRIGELVSAVCPWSSGILCSKREGIREDRRLHACVLPDVTMLDDYSDMLAAIVARLLNSVSHLYLTLLLPKTCRKCDRRQLRKLQKEHGLRLCIKTGYSLQERAAVFRCNDWAVLLSLRQDFGLMALDALACGCPVITLDVEPFSTIVRAGENGILVGCELITTPLRLPTAIPDASNLVDGCLSGFTDNRVLAALQAGLSESSPREEFEKFWQILLS